MKTLPSLSIAPAISMLIALGGTPAVHAASVQSNHSGAICQNYYTADSGMISYWANGIQSKKTTDTPVVCPLVRASVGNGGASAFVDVSHTGSRTTTCALYSIRYDGVILGSTTQSWAGSGFHEFALSLGYGNSNSWSNYSVYCTIPGNYNGTLYGINLYEN
jgi:hypothetical protein